MKMNVYSFVVFLLAGQTVQAHNLGFVKTKDTYAATQQTGAPLQCGVTTKATRTSDKYEMCPKECPYWAQNRKDDDFCTFLCVPADDCPKWNENKPMADTIKKSRTCRGPRVEFCTEAALDGTDTCVRCQTGYALHMLDGQCFFAYWKTLYTSVIVIVVIALAVLYWIVDWCRRPTINEEELKLAEVYASRTIILQPKNVDGHRHPYPINTNLCTQDVAGLGMLLHMRFQAFCIVWPLVIAVFWISFAVFHDELWTIGTKRFGTPRHNCILVAWGYEAQQRLMWTKVAFIAMTYVFSFISFLWFSVSQYRIYKQFDAKEKTMKKFALELGNLPDIPGTPNVEADLKKAVEDATGESVVGVSVAWRFGDNEEDIMKAVKEDQMSRQLALTPRMTEQVQDPTENMNSLQKKFYGLEKSLVGPDDDDKEVDMKKVLTEMVSSESAFVVFKSLGDAERAMHKCGKEGVPFKDIKLTLSVVEVEPTTVNWQNFNETSPEALTRNTIMGFFKIYLPALAFWFFVFYVPYASSLYYFNYDNGAELPAIFGLVFTMVVVIGNAIMYQVCDMASEMIGFKYKDTKQCAYMLMYLAACMINVFLDMGVTYKTALKVMVGLDFRTYDGTRLEHIDTFTAQFETYAMQRSLGGNTYCYAFPSTFLVPFLLEPFITVIAPYRVGRLIIRTHSEVRGSDAEVWIRPFDFDLGRYSDILLNVFLGILIFYFPGGYNTTLFIGMCVSHIWIYVFDHYRILRAIPNINITTYSVDWWAQVALVFCCAVIMSVLVFKANCESYAGYCIQGMPLIAATSVAGVAHFVVHMLLLVYLVPRLVGDVPQVHDDMEYSALAFNEAYNWFTCNPVHCLRSKLLRNHKPHCRFVEAGKEHLLEVCKEIGLHFFDTPADIADPNAPTMTGAIGALKRRFTGKQEEAA